MIINGKDFTIAPRSDLRDANLSYANLRGATLFCADLRDSNLRDANLSYADLRDADLRGANLSYADLRDSNLSGANLSYADLRDSNLRCANLSDADLSGAMMPPLITPEGDIVGYKKVSGGIVKLRIPAEAKRTASWVGNKLRAEYAVVLEGSGYSEYCATFAYKQWDLIRPDAYDNDPRIECTHGIHFFLTRQEAEDY